MNEKASAPASNRSAMMTVFLIVVVDLLGFGIVLPILPITGREYLTPLFPGDDEGAMAARGGEVVNARVREFFGVPPLATKPEETAP